MRALSSPRIRAPRPGFTLVELIVSLLIFALIGGAIVKTLSTGQRAYDAQVQHIDMQQNVRFAAGLLTGELRELDASDGDIQAMDSVSLRIRSMRQMGIVCSLPVLGGALVGVNVLNAVTFVVRDTLQSIRYFAQGDSILVYYEGNSTTRADDSWIAGVLTTNVGASALTNCTDGTKYADGTTRKGRLFTANLYFDQTLTPAQANAAGNIPLGAPIRAFQWVTYRPLKVNNQWYIGFDSSGASATEQPLVGPLTDSLGMKFMYYDSLFNRLAPPYDAATRKKVARISIPLVLKTAAPLRKNVGSPAHDTARVTLEISLRNNRRF
jgi:prepilin-type N-terminal cleavage/methylation domain-containing protein